jgi:hypothetical protein
MPQYEESKDECHDSCYINLSNSGNATEDDIRSFFSGIEIEVSILG